MPIKMDTAAKKSLEIQAKVRQNAQETTATMKDLYAWEKEMKQKELQELSKAPLSNGVNDSNNPKTLPVRSHLIDKAARQQAERQQNKHQKLETADNKQIAEPVTTPDEKAETAPDPKAQKLKEANEIKDIGNTHVKFQQYDLAIDEYSRAIKMCPDVAVFYTNRAFCYLKMDGFEDCVEDCDRAIELDRLAVKAYYRRMQANEFLGNHMDALKDCTTVLTLEPKNTEAKKSLERINEKLRKNLKSQKGPNFTQENENLIEIHAVEKPSYKRSSRPMRRVEIADVIGPKETTTFQNLEISDDDIDKLFNSNCGPFVEVKKENSSKAKQSKEAVKVVEVEEKKPVSTNNANTESSVTEVVKSTPSTITLTNSDELTQKLAQDNDLLKPAVQKAKKNEINAQAESLVTQNRPLPPPPNSTAQFYTHWKELSFAQKHQYLKSIDIKRLSNILGAGFDSDTLADCLRVLHDFYLPQKDSTTSDTLLEISRNDQITILSLFMTADDQKILLEIVDTLKKDNSTTMEDLEAIQTNFNIY